MMLRLTGARHLQPAQALDNNIGRGAGASFRIGPHPFQQRPRKPDSNLLSRLGDTGIAHAQDGSSSPQLA